MESECKAEAKSHGYCRLHYIKNWKLIKLNSQIKAERKLNHYIDRLSRKYPQDYIEKLKEGLEDEGKFKETVDALEMEDEQNEETESEFLEKFLRDIKVDTE